MVSEDDHNIISGGHDEAERLPRGGGHHEGDETSKPGPGIKLCVCDLCKALDIWEYRLDKLVEKVERGICFREKKMGKRRGRLPNVRVG